MKVCINSEQGGEYVKEGGEEYGEVWEINEGMFVDGRGDGKSREEGDYEKVKEYGGKLEEQVEKIKMCGEDGKRQWKRED